MLVAIVFAQTVFFPAITFDDPDYTWQDPHIGGGITADGISWAFSRETSDSHSNWIPLTFISLMLDAEFYGDWAGGYHLTNLLLHAANTVLLYFCLASLTRDLAKSFVVAAIFAVHPLHVESVAWITERKDVLSTMFGLSALFAYSTWMCSRRRKFYYLTLFLFLLSLLSKQTLVTFPFLLLLLDLRPICSFSYAETTESSKLPVQPRDNSDDDSQNSDDDRQSVERLSPQRLALEKLPLLLLAVAFSVGVYLVQDSARTDALELRFRLANAAVASVLYVWRTIWPSSLSIFYPHPLHDVSVGAAIGCSLILVMVSVIATVTCRRRPWLFTGWFWFLGTLVPMIGIVQVGRQQMADRYMYFPQIGLAIVFVWGLAAFLSNRVSRRSLHVGTAVLIAMLTVLCWKQTRLWKDSETLYSHAIQSVDGNYKAHELLGSLYHKAGDTERAIVEYQKANLYEPLDANILAALGSIQAESGRIDEAYNTLVTAIRIAPEHPEARVNLGILLDMTGRQEDAILEFERTLEFAPQSGVAHRELGRIFGNRGDPNRALTHLRQATACSPDDADSWCHLGIVLVEMNRFDEAEDCFSEALRLKPGLEPARIGLEMVR